MRSYKVSTENAPAETPPITWTVPSTWRAGSSSGGMRFATFVAAGEVQITVTPLAGMAGGALENVNRWRGQLGLAPVTEDEFSKLGEPITVNGQPSSLYDLSGKPEGSSSAQRIIGTFIHQEETWWFFKMTGEDKAAGAEKAAFIAFVKSVQFPKHGP